MKLFRSVQGVIGVSSNLASGVDALGQESPGVEAPVGSAAGHDVNRLSRE